MNRAPESARATLAEITELNARIACMATDSDELDRLHSRLQTAVARLRSMSHGPSGSPGSFAR